MSVIKPEQLPKIAEYCKRGVYFLIDFPSYYSSGGLSFVDRDFEPEPETEPGSGHELEPL